MYGNKARKIIWETSPIQLRNLGPKPTEIPQLLCRHCKLSAATVWGSIKLHDEGAGKQSNFYSSQHLPAHMKVSLTYMANTLPIFSSAFPST